MKCNTFVVG